MKEQKKCLGCGEMTKNPKFCSLSCSSSFNMTVYLAKKRNKRIKVYGQSPKKCKCCGKEIEKPCQVINDNAIVVTSSNNEVRTLLRVVVQSQTNKSPTPEESMLCKDCKLEILKKSVEYLEKIKQLEQKETH